MRAYYLQHVPFEGLASIAPWLAAAGYDVTGTRLFEPHVLPDPGEVDFLVAMGGPMSVNDEATHAWLVPEKRLVRAAIEAGKPVLGICLGAQLIASAMGARVYPNRVKEIGWFPVEAVATDGDATFRFPTSFEAFHWHGETFDLPRGAVPLARTEACEHQAFQLGPRVLGLQFHLEMTRESVRAIASHCRDEIVPSSHVQTEATIVGAGEETYRATNRLMGEVLGYLREATR